MNALHRHEEERVEEVLQNLRAKGIRITDTRRAVLSYLVASHEHPSAEKIYRDLLPQFPSMSLATVYNNIKVLIDEGVVSEIKVRNDTTTYFDFMGHDHLNVVCEKCGRIADVDRINLFLHKNKHSSISNQSRQALFCEKLHFSMVATRFFTENLVE